MQIRHNLVVGEKPFFRRGGCVLKTAYHLEKDENIGLFGMRRLRLGSALAGALGGAQRGSVRGAVAARPRGHSHSGGAGRPGGAVRYPHPFRIAEQSGADRRKHRGSTRGGRFPISPTASSNLPVTRALPSATSCRSASAMPLLTRVRHRILPNALPPVW